MSVVERSLGFALFAVLPLLAVWRLLGLSAAIFCAGGAALIRAACRRRQMQLWERQSGARAALAEQAAAADLHARIAARIEADGGLPAEADIAAIAAEVAVITWQYVIVVGDDDFREAVQRHRPPAAAGPGGEGELWRG